MRDDISEIVDLRFEEYFYCKIEEKVGEKSYEILTFSLNCSEELTYFKKLISPANNFKKKKKFLIQQKSTQLREIYRVQTFAADGLLTNWNKLFKHKYIIDPHIWCYIERFSSFIYNKCNPNIYCNKEITKCSPNLIFVRPTFEKGWNFRIENFLNLTSDNFQVLYKFKKKEKQQMIINENEHELDCSTYFNGNNLDVIFPLLLSSDQEKDELLLKQFQKDAIGLGYFVNSLWIWKHCHYSIKSNKSMENYQEWMNQMGHKRNLLETTWIGDKLKYKHLVIVGDFISRLYFLHLSKILKEYKKNWQFESSRKSSNENMELFLKDFSISWYHHGLPILHNSYLNRIWSIEEIFNNFIEFYKNHDHRVPSHLLINFDNLFATFPHDYYEHRLSSIVHSLIELMRRLPYIRVMYRGSDRQMMVDERIHLSPLNLKKMNYINKSLVQLMNAKFVRLMHHTLRNETFHLRERFIFIYTYSLTELDVNCTNLYEICENALIHQLFQILQHL